MRDQWLPISYSEHLRPKDVLALRILGDPICLFRNAEGTAACLADRCLSRGDPVSLGRVEGANLQTRYHGWQYDVTGRVCKIPSVTDDACAKRQLRLYAYPICERFGRVWVWPGKADAADVADIPDPMGGSPASQWRLVFNQAWDVDCDPLLVMENMSDLTHYYFVHDGTIARRKDAHSVDPVTANFDLEPILGERWAGKQGQSVRITVPATGDTFEQAYYGPCHIMSTQKNKAGTPLMRVLFHIVPVSRGHCRVMTTTLASVGTAIDKAFKMPGMKKFFAWLSDRAFYQDYEVLYHLTRQVRLGVHSLKCPMPADFVSLAVKKACTESLAEPHKAIEQDEHYRVRLAQFWFAGWECVAGEQEPFAYAAAEAAAFNDSDYVAPVQKGVERSAYTSRRLRRMK